MRLRGLVSFPASDSSALGLERNAYETAINSKVYQRLGEPGVASSHQCRVHVIIRHNDGSRQVVPLDYVTDLKIK